MSSCHKRLTILVLSAALLGGPLLASAQLDANNTGLTRAAAGTGITAGCAAQGSACIAGIVGKIVAIALGFVGMVLFLIFLVGGFMYMTAGGEADQVKKAKNLLKNAVIGAIIITVAYILTNFVISTLSATVTP